jgi:FdhE protein
MSDAGIERAVLPETRARESRPFGELPHVRLPHPEALFARRARRFSSLAPSNTLAEHLDFLAALASAQRVACAAVKPALSVGRRAAAMEVSTVSETGAGRDRPLNAVLHDRHPSWRDGLQVIVAAFREVSLTAASRAALDRLAALPAGAVEALAERVLTDAVEGEDLAASPFAAAALQVYFTSLATQLDARAIARTRQGCPACGSLPLVGVVRGPAVDDELRYLVCSLCATQWRPQAECIACHDSSGITSFALDVSRSSLVGGGRGQVRAEACATCKAYTKLLCAERDPHLEPLADDVATLALDLRMAEAGWARHGVNLLMLPGDDAAASLVP